LTLRRGEEVHYDTLVTTMPIPEFINRCSDLPSSMKRVASGLAYVSVYNVNLGVAREGVSEGHWIYFPEREYPFYRVGFPMNFSASLSPPGSSSLYVEISHHPEESAPEEKLLKEVREGLIQAGVLLPQDEVVVSHVHDIHYAYVIFNRYRQRHLPSLLQALARRGIYSIGRYGAWEHTSMEDAIWQGRETAERLLEG
jgi:protoporphyrinogen oxidase